MANPSIPTAVMSKNLIVYGSHGELKIHALTGIIIERRNDPTEPDDPDSTYPDIARFDPAIFAGEPSRERWDILATAYWTHEGQFAPALTVRLATDRRGGLEFDDWVPLALLPPAHASSSCGMDYPHVAVRPWGDVEASNPPYKY